MTPEEAYSYRCFDHHKRETYPIIAKIIAGLDGDLRLLDLSCGPAVLEGVVYQYVGDRLAEIHLWDYEEGFLQYAETHLKERIKTIHTKQFDMNVVDQHTENIGPLNVVVSVNALFHAQKENLENIYSYVFENLKDGGLFINQLTFGGTSAAFTDTYAQHLQATPNFDPIDQELFMRSKLDTELAGGPVNTDGGGGYRGLDIDANTHIDILQSKGFTAAEIWRKGKSALILAEKSVN